MILGLERLPPSIAAYNAAADAAVAAGGWRGALGLLQAAAQRSLQQSLVTLGTALKARAGGTWPQVLWQLEAMQHCGLEHGIRHSNEVMRSLGTWSWSLSILERAMAKNLGPSEFTSSLLLWVEPRSWTLAVHVFGDLERQGLQHDTVSINSVLQAASAERRYSKNLVQQLKQNQELVVDSATCSAAATVADSEEVSELLEMIKASRQQPDVGAYTSLLSALDRDGRWEVAVDTFGDTLADGVEMAGSMAAALVSACDTGRRWAQAIDSGLLRHGLQLDLVLASARLSGLAGSSWRRAWQGFCQLVPATLQPDILTHGAVATAAEKGQQWDMALDTMRWHGVKLDLVSLNSVVSACEKGQRWQHAQELVAVCMAQLMVVADAISFNSAILASTTSRRWLQGFSMMRLAAEGRVTPQVASFGALLMECEGASPEILSCQQELLKGSLEAAGLDLYGAVKRSRKVRFMELCCPQDDRHHTLRRDFGKFDEKRFNEFRSFLIAENEKNRSGGNRQTDFFRLVYRQLKAENLSAAIMAASNAQAALKQSNLSDRDLADGLREQELLEGGARWLCLMLKVQAVAPHLFPSRKPGSENQIQKERGSRLMSRGRRASVAKQSSSGRRSSISGLDLVMESKE
eukprot:s3358_g2.t2